MEIIKEPTNVQIQLTLNDGSRRNLYVIAKWFNLASFILAALSFFILVGIRANLASEIKSGNYVGASSLTVYTVVMTYSLINCAVSFFFWCYLRSVIKNVGSHGEAPHIALGVCDLLFINLISGILILMAASSLNRSQVLRTIVDQQLKEQVQS